MSNDLEAINARFALARQIAVEAGKLTLEYFQRDDLVVDRKSDASPVTVADREAEQLLRGRIAAEFPDDGIIGEEFGSSDGTSGYNWVLDPIDGTKSFISGVPLYGTMVGVERDGRCEVGAVYIPGLDELIFAAKGQGAWHVVGDAQPQQAQVSTTDKLSEATLVTSEIATFDERKGGMDAFGRLNRSARLVRTWGDCYGYLLVATGRADIMIDPVMNVWDAAAVQIIVEEAGGLFTDWQGIAAIDSGDGFATNGRLHPAVQKIISDRE